MTNQRKKMSRDGSSNDPYLQRLLEMPTPSEKPQNLCHTFRVTGTFAGIPVDLTVQHTVTDASPVVESSIPTEPPTRRRAKAMPLPPQPAPVGAVVDTIDLTRHLSADEIADVLEVHRPQTNALLRTGVIPGVRVAQPGKIGRFKYVWVASVDAIAKYIQTALHAEVQERYENRLNAAVAKKQPVAHE